MKILFVCNANLQRSPTAEEIFKNEYDVKSAGVSELARKPLTAELLKWADIIFVMEGWQRSYISEKFPKLYLKKKIMSLDIPDVYYFMDKKLVKLLRKRVNKYLK